MLGLKKALDHIDEIIKLIKKSKDTDDARAGLMSKFKFSEIQANAILEMRLQKLAGLERKAVEEELKEKQGIIEDLKELLASAKKILQVVATELEAVKEKYGDERRTRVIKGGVKAMSDAQAHRGPDASDVWTAPGVGLGHRRLSIIDLSPTLRAAMRQSPSRHSIRSM